MNIDYCEKCSGKVDGDPFVDPATSARYCAKCAALLPQLVKLSDNAGKKSSRRLPAIRMSPPGGTPLPRKTPAGGTPVQAAQPGVPPPAFTQAGGNMAFYFCESCGRRLNEKDLEEGRARNKQVKGIFCTDCAKGVNTVTFDAISMEDVKARKRELAASNTPETAGALAAHYNARARQKSAGGDSPKTAKASNGWMAGAAVGFVALIALVFFAMRDRSPASQPVTTKSSESNTSAATITPKNSATSSTAPVTVPPKSTTTVTTVATPAATATAPAVTNTPEPAAPARLGLLSSGAADDSTFNSRASTLLKEAQDWYAQNGNDAWTYKDKLEKVASSYRSSPAGQEAAKILAELKLPPDSERPPEHMDWHKDWKISEGAREVVFLAEFDGRAYVLQTHPIAPGKPCVTSKTMNVPEQRPFLEIRMRANERGDHRYVVSIDGREMMSEILAGKEWRNFAFDLTPLKGKSVEVALIHHNTAWMSEQAYLQAPRFIDKPAANAKVFRWKADGAPTPPPPAPVEQPVARVPGTIDVLALIDASADAVKGEWKRTPEGLECNGSNQYPRLQLPLLPPAEYDYTVSFTRTSGKNALCLVGSQGNHDFLGMIGGWTDKYSYLGEINNSPIEQNPSRKDFGGRITNGKKQTVVLEVRKAGVRLLLDGEVLSEWKTTYNDMTLDRNWKLRDSFALGLGVFLSNYTIHSIHLREVEGVCKPLRGVTIKRD